MAHLIQLLSGLRARYMPPKPPLLVLEEPERPEIEFISRDDSDCLCPVTRQALAHGTRVYQCQQCHMVYSMEGWAFLCEADKGRCCGCGSQNTVLATLRGAVEQED